MHVWRVAFFEFLGETLIGNIFLLEGSNWRFSFSSEGAFFFYFFFYENHSLFLGEHFHNSDKQNLDFCDT